MLRTLLQPAVGVGIAAVVIAHLGVLFLPGTLHGLPTPILMLGGAATATLAAIRYL